MDSDGTLRTLRLTVVVVTAPGAGRWLEALIA